MSQRSTALVTAGVLFLLGVCVVLFSPPTLPILAVATLGGCCVFGSIALVCVVERKLADGYSQEPLIEGTTNQVSEAFHSAVYEGFENPGAIAMVEKGEEMVNEGERLIRSGEYNEGKKLVDSGMKRINLGERLQGKKGGVRA